jgi:hypothetical protein
MVCRLFGRRSAARTQRSPTAGASAPGERPTGSSHGGSGERCGRGLSGRLVCGSGGVRHPESRPHEAAPVGGGAASTTGGVCVSRGAWSVRRVRSSPSCGTCGSRLASYVGQAVTLWPRTPLVLGTGAGLFRMEGRHRGVLPPYEGLPRAIARESRELSPLESHDSAYLLRNVHLPVRIGHSTTANVP